MEPEPLFVPYNDAMRLGDGYNSFLQVPCITNSVSVPPEKIVCRQAGNNGNESQLVVKNSYQFVGTISDFTDFVDSSAAASTIKNGGDEGYLKAIVSVHVIIQTTQIVGSPAFQPAREVRDSKEFFKVHGDCYISGFVQGGRFIGILSAKVPDGSAKVEVKNAIRSLAKSASTQGKASSGNEASSSSALRKVETTITVACSGGGQIKDPREEWTPDSLFQAAAAFPSRVKECPPPQTTYAILTPYSSNQSFVEWAAKKNIKVPQFGAANVRANNLLDVYGEYKNYVKRIQTTITEAWKHTQSDAEDGPQFFIKALLDVRTSMKDEMRKIAQTVDKMNDEPEQAEELVKKAEIIPPRIWSMRFDYLVERVARKPERR